MPESRQDTQPEATSARINGLELQYLFYRGDAGDLPEPRNGKKNGGGLTLACSPEREAAMFMGSSQLDPWPLLSRVPDPMLILEGEQSENRAFIDLKKAAALFPRGRYRMVEGAGHLVPQEKPAETARILREFFQA
jgi:pimeloyl-ACP methyl ester carboxylesterase